MEINKLKQKLKYLITQREKCEKVIFNRDIILEGVYREFYKVCGRKSCWCYKGDKKHGPYHKIEVIREGKQKVYIVPKNKVLEVTELYNNRKKLLEAENKIKSINDEIYEVIKGIKKLKEKRVDKRWLR